jgi:hypothetical protein
MPLDGGGGAPPTLSLAKFHVKTCEVLLGGTTWFSNVADAPGAHVAPPSYETSAEGTSTTSGSAGVASNSRCAIVTHSPPPETHDVPHGAPSGKFHRISIVAVCIAATASGRVSGVLSLLLHVHARAAEPVEPA